MNDLLTAAVCHIQLTRETLTQRLNGLNVLLGEGEGSVFFSKKVGGFQKFLEAETSIF